jgi:methionyl-tRNA formyltransferase
MFLLATKKGYEVVKYMNKSHKDLIGCVSTFKDVNVREKYNLNIAEYCNKNNIVFYDYEILKPDLEKFILQNKITNIIAIGWKYLLSMHIVKYLKNNIIVFHDSLLPKYRGFSPTPTAVICGEKRIGLSVIFASDDIDNGDILIQKSMEIDDSEYMNEIIDKSVNLYIEALEELLPMIRSNSFKRVKQDEKLATYSIWRDELDCKIDWNKSSTEIFNLVRAVSHPYTGAYTYLNGRKIIINRAEKADYDINFTKRDSGKIWSIDGGRPVVVCGSGLLVITDAEYENGEKVIFNKLRVRLRWD